MFIDIQDTIWNTRYIKYIEIDFDSSDDEPFAIVITDEDDSDISYGYKSEIKRNEEFTRIKSELKRKIIFSKDGD